MVIVDSVTFMQALERLSSHGCVFMHELRSSFDPNVPRQMCSHISVCVHVAMTSPFLPLAGACIEVQFAHVFAVTYYLQW